jgi:hypothetical protein
MAILIELLNHLLTAILLHHPVREFVRYILVFGTSTDEEMRWV